MCVPVSSCLNAYCWFINLELIDNSAIHAWLIKAYPAHLFSLKAHHSFLEFRNTRQHLNTRLRGHFKWLSHKKRSKNVKSTALNGAIKGHLSQQESPNKMCQSEALRDLSWGWVRPAAQFLCYTEHVRVRDRKGCESPWVLFGVTSKF